MDYWERRYSKGGFSGPGSIGNYRSWKWNTILEFENSIDDVIDIGCGDLSFWEGRNCSRYIGIDGSPTIISRNRNLRPSWEFILSSADILQPAQGKIVFCFDLLFHIIDDEIYKKILYNLCKYSQDWIFIYTWHKNPFRNIKIRYRVALKRIIDGNILNAIKVLLGSDTDYEYQKYRNLIDNLDIFEKNGFKLIKVIPIPYDSWGAMYVFRKLIS